MKKICPNCLHENFTSNKYCKVCSAILETPSIKTIKAALARKRKLPIIPIAALTLIILLPGTIAALTVLPRMLKGNKTVESIKDTPLIAGETEIDGQIFVVTQGAGTYKLSLVSVFVQKQSGEPVATVKTDADGKFSLKLPRGEYAFKAYASRKVWDETEFYEWDVPVRLEQAKQQVFLSNDNVIVK